ncbi:MAG TPA: hypothetical protein VFV80_08305 [Geminicoccaceae bacterium]|nr:hypothetical protein [Geminicoccaceae bacterium]
MSPLAVVLRLGGRAAVLLLTLLAAGAAAAQDASSAGMSETCRVGVNVEELYDLNLAQDSFGAVLWLWSLCPSARSAPLDTIAFPTGSALQLGEVRSSRLDDGRYYQYRRVEGTFRHDWDVRHYPFDRQRLTIPIDETDLGTSVVRFEADSESSFLSPAVRRQLDEWDVSDLTVQASVTIEPSTYGLPDEDPDGYARLEATLVLERTQILTFVKLTAGVFAAALIALLALFLDPHERGSFSSRLGVLAGVLFGVLLNMRAADAFIGDTSRLTLVSEIHLVALGLIVVIALITFVEHRRIDRDRPVPYPNWLLAGAAVGLYLLTNLALVAAAAWS